ELELRQRLRAVVEQIATRCEPLDILVPGLRIHRHQQVITAAPPQPAGFTDPHFVPGRQALDVGREDVARADRHAHAQDALGEQLVRRGRTRAIDVGELDDEVVGGEDAIHAPPRTVPTPSRTGASPPTSERRETEGDDRLPPMCIPPRLRRDPLPQERGKNCASTADAVFTPPPSSSTAAQNSLRRDPHRIRRTGTGACPTLRSGSVRRKARNASRHLRPSPSRARSSPDQTRTNPGPYCSPARSGVYANRLHHHWP